VFDRFQFSIYRHCCCRNQICRIKDVARSSMKQTTQFPPTITETIAELQRALSDYIEATYHISDEGMVRQRQRLLNKEGVIYRKPFIESTPRYQTGDDFASTKGLPKQVGEFLTSLSVTDGNRKGLLFNPPYTHQGKAILDTLVKDKSLIVMTGTGSGKTRKLSSANPRQACNRSFNEA
jgi:hypothetical protein